LVLRISQKPQASLVTEIGFEMAEVDLMLQEPKPEKNDPADDFIIEETAQAVTGPGDL
jgi:hypothetical protein